MNRLGHLTQLIGMNTVPVAGVFWGNWSDATAIAFYWCETALIVLFVSLRLILHRRSTNKRGHYVEKKTSTNGGPWKHGITTYNVSFLTTAIAFGVGNLIFLAVILGLFQSAVGGGDVSRHALSQGLLVALVFLVIGFVIDIPGIGHRPFAWVRLKAEGALGRVFVVYLAIFIGLFCAMVLELPRAMFAVFFSLKLLTDVASNFKEYNPQRPPPWMSRLVKDRATLEKEWQAQLERQAEDEETFRGRPSRPTAVASTQR